MTALINQVATSNTLKILPQGLILIDKVLDFVPFGSTASNVIDLGLKHFAFNQDAVTDSPFKDYIEHIKTKSTKDCVIYGIPFLGNAIKIGQVAASYLKPSGENADDNFYPFPPARDEMLFSEKPDKSLSSSNSIENIAW